jgi:hypothetical protein
MQHFHKGQTYKGYDREGYPVQGIVVGILKTKYSLWLVVSTSTGKRLIQERP